MHHCHPTCEVAKGIVQVLASFDPVHTVNDPCTTMSMHMYHIAVCSHPTSPPTLYGHHISNKLRERLEVVNYHCFVPMFTIDVHTWCCPVYFPMPFQTNCSINTICMLYHVKVLFSNCPNLWSFAFSCSCAISANLYLFPVTLHTLYKK